MFWSSQDAPLHAGRHKAPRPDQVGRALRRALVATLAPAVVFALIGWLVFALKRGKVLDVAFDPTALLWVAVLIGVVWSLWVSLIWRIYARNRSRTATTPFRVIGALGVGIMCLAVSAPMPSAPGTPWCSATWCTRSSARTPARPPRRSRRPTRGATATG